MGAVSERRSLAPALRAGGANALGAPAASRGRAPRSALGPSVSDRLTSLSSPRRVHFPLWADAARAARVDALRGNGTRGAETDRFRHRP